MNGKIIKNAIVACSMLVIIAVLSGCSNTNNSSVPISVGEESSVAENSVQSGSSSPTSSASTDNDLVSSVSETSSTNVVDSAEPPTSC